MNRQTRHILVRQIIILAVTLALGFAVSGCSMQSQIDELSKEVDKVEKHIREIRERLNSLLASVSTLQLQINTQATVLNELVAAETANEADIVDAQAELVILQAQYNAVVSEITILQSNVQIQAVLDPCGDGPGYDEVVLKTSAGYLAYFENGNHRYLTLLQEGVTYTTTDNSHCEFSIINGQLTF